jgi:hypothetical protein
MSDRTDTDPVAVWESGDTVYIAPLPRGPITVLEGSAATIWLAAHAGPIEGAADRVAGAMGLEVEGIRATVDEFVGRLIAQGLLSRVR